MVYQGTAIFDKTLSKPPSEELALRKARESLDLEREIIGAICQGAAALSGFGGSISVRDSCRNATRPTVRPLSTRIPMEIARGPARLLAPRWIITHRRGHPLRKIIQRVQLEDES